MLEACVEMIIDSNLFYDGTHKQVAHTVFYWGLFRSFIGGFFFIGGYFYWRALHHPEQNHLFWRF